MKIASIYNEFVPMLVVILRDEKTGAITYLLKGSSKEESKDEYAATREEAENYIYAMYHRGWDLEFVEE